MSLTNVAFAIVAAFVALMVAMQVAMRRRARAMTGKSAPDLPGALGQALRARARTLVYFYSPSCGACRPLTPKIRELERRGGSVFLVNIAEDMAVARAFRVMATPSIVEVVDGVISAFHIGSPPAELLARFS